MDVVESLVLLGNLEPDGALLFIIYQGEGQDATKLYVGELINNETQADVQSHQEREENGLSIS